MGHLFVPAALVLWVVVAVVRTFSAPTPAQAPVPAVTKEVAPPRPEESADTSVSEADRSQARMHGEG